MYLNKKRGIVLKQATKIKSKIEVHVYEMIIFFSMKTFGNFILNHLYALCVSVRA